MAPIPMPSLGHPSARRWVTRVTVFVVLLVGVVATTPAQAQLTPPVEPVPVGYLVWANNDGSRIRAYAELYSISGLQVEWDGSDFRAGDYGNERWYFPGDTDQPSITFILRFDAFQYDNLTRQMAQATTTPGSWYVVLTNSALSGGAGTYMYWRFPGLLKKVQLQSFEGVPNFFRIDVEIPEGSEIQGVNSCVVTRSGASGACVLPAATLAVVLPQPRVNQRTWVQVTARDVLGQRVRSYRGTVHFTARRPTGAAVRAVLPADFTFRTANAGNKVFNNVVFRESGRQELLVQDTGNPSLRGRVGFNVVAPPTGCSATGAGCTTTTTST